MNKQRELRPDAECYFGLGRHRKERDSDVLQIRLTEQRAGMFHNLSPVLASVLYRREDNRGNNSRVIQNGGGIACPSSRGGDLCYK